MLGHLVRRCLAKDSDDRWQSAHDVLLQLRWLQEVGTAADTRLPPGRLRTREWVAWARVGGFVCRSGRRDDGLSAPEPGAASPDAILGPATGAGDIQAD